MKIFYNYNTLENVVKRSLVDAKDNLTSTITECGNINIPYGFSYANFLNSLSDNLSQINNSISDLINWTNNCKSAYESTTQALNVKNKQINNNALPKATTIIGL